MIWFYLALCLAFSAGFVVGAIFQANGRDEFDEYESKQ
jgi:hypothetical protein